MIVYPWQFEPGDVVEGYWGSFMLLEPYSPTDEIIHTWWRVWDMVLDIPDTMYFDEDRQYTLAEVAE